MSNGVYVHIPFCRQKCLYCDFNSYAGQGRLFEPYTAALLKELREGLPASYDTVFIGGGTPTALPMPLLLSIVERLAAGAPEEFTVEVNPATVDLEGFCAMKKAGVNRISFGVQSAFDHELKALGRIHTWREFLQSYHAARAAGFSNISLDLMFALPGQTVTSWLATLERAVSLSPEHLSCYSLIIEEGTPFYGMELSLPDEEEDRAMYHEGVAFLKANGYGHYEISNFARPGFSCLHNVKYWTGQPYYGFGAGAHSFFGGVRYENTKNPAEYIRENRRMETLISPREREAEFLFLGLRMMEGISLEEYKARFGADFEKKYRPVLERYGDYLLCREGRAYLTLEGVSVSNVILSEFLPD